MWSPTYTKCELEAQEGPLRRFTERIEGMYGLNYWQRLEKVKLSSINRRVERFRIFYTWKSLNGKVPSLGFTMIDHPKYGRQINIRVFLFVTYGEFATHFDVFDMFMKCF